MTPPSIANTVCISDKSKLCVHTKAPILDISEQGRSDWGYAQ